MTQSNHSDYSRSGTGTPLVLLHGAFGSWRVWNPVIPFLEAAHDVYAPTLPGHHGANKLSRGGGSVVEIANIIGDQLDAQGLPTAHLVGNSLGGAVALELARQGRARSVVAIAPFGAWRTRFDREQMVVKVRAGNRVLGSAVGQRLLRQTAGRRALLRPVVERGDRIPADMVDVLLEDLRGCTAVPEVIAAARRDGPIAPFDSIGQPVCVAWPQHDRIIPYRRYGAPMVERIPGAEVVHLEGCGHVPMFDDPNLVAKTILDTTTRVPPPSAVSG